jgi:hypothetical protein
MQSALPSTTVPAAASSGRPRGQKHLGVRVRWAPAGQVRSRATPGPGRTRSPALGQEHRQSSEGLAVGSVIKKRRKRMAKKKHRKLLKKTRVQRRNKK